MMLSNWPPKRERPVLAVVEVAVVAVPAVPKLPKLETNFSF